MDEAKHKDTEVALLRAALEAKKNQDILINANNGFLKILLLMQGKTVNKS